MGWLLNELTAWLDRFRGRLTIAIEVPPNMHDDRLVEHCLKVIGPLQSMYLSMGGGGLRIVSCRATTTTKHKSATFVLAPDAADPPVIFMRFRESVSSLIEDIEARL